MDTVGYNGIVPTDTVVWNVDRLAITPRFLIVRTMDGSFEVVGVEDGKRKPTHYPTLDAVNDELARTGARGVSEGDFRTFGEVYAEHGSGLPPLVRTVVALAAIGCVGEWLLRGWRRWRRIPFRT